MTTNHKCPQCPETIVQSKPRTVWERGIRDLSPFSPYLCSACDWRGWRLSRRKAKKWRTAVLVLILIAGLATIFALLHGIHLSLAVLPEAVARHQKDLHSERSIHPTNLFAPALKFASLQVIHSGG